jgi:hypothetical protein
MQVNYAGAGDKVWHYSEEFGWRAAVLEGVRHTYIRKIGALGGLLCYDGYVYEVKLLPSEEKFTFTSTFIEWGSLRRSKTLAPRDGDSVGPPCDHLRLIHGHVEIHTPLNNFARGHMEWRPAPISFRNDPADPTTVRDGMIWTEVGREDDFARHDVVLLWDTIRECPVMFTGFASWNGKATKAQVEAANQDREFARLRGTHASCAAPASSIQYVLDQPRVGQLARVISDKGKLDERPLPVGTVGRITALEGDLAVLTTAEGEVGVHDARNLKNTPPEGFAFRDCVHARESLAKAWGFRDGVRIIPNLRGIAGQTGFVIAHERTVTPKDIWNVPARVQPA